MGSFSSARAALASVVVVVVIGLSACATAVEEPPLATGQPTASPTPVEDSLAAPQPVFDLDCEDAVPTQRIAELYGPDVLPLDFSYAGIDEMNLRVVAALSDGALVCHWSLPGAGLPIATLTATVAAPGQYAVSFDGHDEIPRPSPPVPILDGARAECRDNYPMTPLEARCDWSVYSGDVWIVASFTELPAAEVNVPAVRENPDTSSNRPTSRADSVSAGILIDAAAALVESERRPIDSAVGTLATCDDVISSPQVLANVGTVDDAYDQSAFDIDAQISAFAPFGGAIGALGVERQGWTWCTVFSDSEAGYGFTTITIGQNAAWVLADGAPGIRYGVPLVDADGIANCVVDEGGAYCSVALTTGEHIVAVTMSTEDQVLTESLARAVASLID